ncbi:MAG: DUF6036 family nucleotidyltransferase [Gemmatimonadaceae bacterium]
MRALADRARIERFMEALAREAHRDVRVYLVGGTTAVLLGWRPATIDVDLVIEPEDDALLRAVPQLKESLQINVEFASPAHFLPVPPGWQDRSTFVGQRGRVAFYHFDLYAQALAKIERGHPQDLRDVREMISRQVIDVSKARQYFERMEPELYRFPAIDPPTFRMAVEEALVPSG